MNTNSGSIRVKTFLVAGAALALVNASSWAAPRGEYVRDELIVILNTEPSGKDAATIRRELEEVDKLLPGQAEKSFRIGAKRVVKRMKLPPGLTVEQAMARSIAHPRVLAIEPNYIIRGDATVPNDLQFRAQWGLHNTVSIGSSTPDADIDAPEAWDITTGSSSVVVAVVDSGLNMAHVDMVPNVWANPRETPGNGRDDDHNGYVDDTRGWDFWGTDKDPDDRNSHGTHVAGIIGARGNNSTAGAGVAWNVRLMACKFLDANGEGTAADAAEAICYAVENGARIINASFGSTADSTAVRDAVDFANDEGVLFVCTAGNLAQNNDETPYYPSSYSFANVISVVATDRRDGLAGFSSYGATSTDIGAPGDGILSTTINGTAAMEEKSGTSQAAPFVSGTAALMWSVNPSLTVAQVKAILLTTGDALGSLAGKTSSGRRLNAHNAVRASTPGATWVDFANNGIESGSFEAPFSTLAEGVAAAGSAGRIVIKAGSGGERLTITEAVTIEAFGGTAAIGH